MPADGAPRRPDRAPGRGPRSAPRRRAPRETTDALWLFGVHAVADALANPRRARRRLLLTPNARVRLTESLGQDPAAFGIEPEIQDPRRFAAPLDPASVHQGAALETDPLDWGDLETACAPADETDRPRVVLLDRVTDPHNVGAVLRSAEVFGARAVVAPKRHAAPETGALAKAASGALERQPYLRVGNLGDAIETLQGLGYVVIGLDGDATLDLDHAAEAATEAPLALALGAEGAGLRQRTKSLCDVTARIPSAGGFGSLNVSNAAAVALFATRTRAP